MPLDPRREFRRWLEQAYSDLDDAEYNARGERYNLACFLAQQAAEKALKAYLYLRGNQVVWGLSVAELVDDAGQYVPSFRPLRDKGAYLDRFYIPTRYPNGLPGGIPRDAFTSKDCVESVSVAREIADFISPKGKEEESWRGVSKSWFRGPLRENQGRGRSRSLDRSPDIRSTDGAGRGRGIKVGPRRRA